MSGRVLKWVGGVLFAGTAIGMGAYFYRVGLEDADRWGSVIAAFIALAGLAMALFGTRTAPRDTRAGSDADHSASHPAPASTPADTGKDTGKGTGKGAVESPMEGAAGDAAAPGDAAAEETAPGGVRNEITGGTFHGPVIQGRTISHVAFGPPTPSSAPSEEEKEGGSR
ncbi:hypothetical protein [Streptosporangium carneum]|uniref:Uncharacterized protein n=1 Tax=Streptosporangium carneum TaxID=47481 RepID=A0A9W6I0L1_9ACTN|nr:hypothetical protein [Streptosporangium carneum]GLK09498.1 hypothetical protein GCM10017600_29040 [Streptosporangium carneum]